MFRGKRRFLVLVSLFIGASAFAVLAASDTPLWLQIKIAQGSTHKKARFNVQEVSEYLYRGERVYYLRNGCCDQQDVVFSESGDEICWLGGMMGKEENTACPDFLKTAEKKRVLHSVDPQQ